MMYSVGKWNIENTAVSRTDVEVVTAGTGYQQRQDMKRIVDGRATICECVRGCEGEKEAKGRGELLACAVCE